jgi:hypothetical protein
MRSQLQVFLLTQRGITRVIFSLCLGSVPYAQGKIWEETKKTGGENTGEEKVKNGWKDGRKRLRRREVTDKMRRQIISEGKEGKDRRRRQIRREGKDRRRS